MSFCPYCGSELGAAPPAGALPGTVVCPTCGQELDAPPADGEQPGWAASPPPPPPPPPGWESAGPAGGPPPAWESGEGGVLLRLWRTTWQVLLHPVRTLAAPGMPGYGYPLGYALVLSTLGWMSQALYQSLEGGEIGLVDSPLGILLFPVGVLLMLFFSTALIHATLFLLRGSHKGFAATFRAVAYCQAARIWFLIPVVGVLVGSLWQLVVLVGGLSAVHGTGRVRAFLALVLPVFLLMILVVVIVTAFGLGALLGGGLPGMWD